MPAKPTPLTYLKTKTGHELIETISGAATKQQDVTKIRYKIGSAESALAFKNAQIFAHDIQILQILILE